CRTGRSWDYVRRTAHLNNVGRMPSACALAVKSVDRPVFEGANCVFDKAAFIEGVGMNHDLNVHIVGNGKTTVDRGWRCTPVFVEFQAAGPGFNLFKETRRGARIALSEEAEVNRKGVGSL